MTLRGKLLLPVALACLALVGLVYLLIATVLLDGLGRIEQESARDDMKRVIHAFKQRFDSLESKAADWAQWDEAVHFMRESNIEFVRANLIPQSLVKLRISTVVFVRPDGVIHAQRELDPDTTTPAFRECALPRLLRPDGPLLSHPDADSVVRGLVGTHRGPMLVVSRPILPSTGEGRIAGTLLFGQYVDQRMIDDIAAQTLVGVRWRPSRPGDPPPARPDERDASILAQAGAQAIRSAATLADIDGRPLMLLRADSPRHASRHGMVSARYLVLGVALVGAVCMAAVLLLVDRILLRPLWRLSKDVRKVSRDRSASARVSVGCKDELGELAADINAMLAGLEAAARKTARDEAELRKLALVASRTDNAVLICDSRGRIEWVNDGFARLSGLTPRQVEGLNHEEVLRPAGHPGDPANDDAVALGSAARSQRMFLMPDGRRFWLDVELQPVEDERGQITHQVVIASDITERRRAEQFRDGYARVLERIAAGDPLEDVLLQVIDIAEELTPGMKASILLVDGLRVRKAYTRSLPPEYMDLVEGLTLDENCGACGPAVVRGVRVIIENVFTDPRWAGYHELAEKMGWQAAWSQPIVSSSGTVHGTFALYFDRPRSPDDLESRLLETAAHLANIAIDRSQAEERIRHDSTHDALTALPNRTLLRDRLERCIARQKRRRDYRFAVLFMDLDRFKVINDSMGHATGDQLLNTVARRIEACIRAGDTISSAGSGVGRLGGDEFIILLDDIRDPKDAMTAADRILSEVARPCVFDGAEVIPAASIGIVLSDPRYETADQMLRDADTAMYRAKAAGKGRYELFDHEMHMQIRRRLELENDLRHAIDRGELRPFYQPIISLASGELTGFEALMRWNHGRLGMVSPSVFIPIAEETGLIVPLGEWMLREAMRQLAAWRGRLSLGRSLIMSVNLSPRQIARDGLVEMVASAVREAGVEAGSLQLEITETAVMEDDAKARTVMRRLREVGVRMALDDFGTGHSSLSCLHRFPLDAVKIDRSFVASLSEKGPHACVVAGIIHLCHSLSLRVTAEGVEDDVQSSMLSALRCDNAQGFLYAPAIDAQQAERLIEAMSQPLAQSA